MNTTSSEQCTSYTVSNAELYNENEANNYSNFETCGRIRHNGKPCGSGFLDNELKTVFQVTVCRGCRSENEEYDLITKTDAMTKYLVTATTLKNLRHLPKINIHHPSWAPIQLYLRKQVKEAAIRRFGSEEELNKERTLRGEKSFQKELVKIKDTMGDHSKEFRLALSEVNSSSTAGTDIVRKESVVIADDIASSNSSSKTKKSKSTITGKRKAALMDMVSSIRG